ncbi:MAG: NAD(P)H-dependent oxidoreductase [Micrococcales bacterium]|nr:NAD(P)H-dependent oxidoreductase [Micrococcales bacterium]
MPVTSPKKVLVVLGHPDSLSYCAALFDAYIKAAKTAGHQVETINLSAEQFDPVLRHGFRERMAPDPVIQRSQELITWADHLVLIYPNWWSGIPALLSGWISRVFTPGVAFSYKAGIMPVKHLEGRAGTVILTSRSPAWTGGVIGSSVKRQIKTRVLGYCGIKPVRLVTLGNIGTKKDTPERRAAFLEKVRRLAAGPLPGQAPDPTS